MIFIYGDSKFLLSWKIVAGLAHWWTQQHGLLNRKRLESKNYEAALLLGSPVSQWPEGGRWLIFMSLSTPAYINQSQPPSCKGVGHGWCGKREIVRATVRERGSRKREMGCCHFKGLWTGHHAFCSATAAQEFGNFSHRTQGLELIHANVWPHMCGVILIFCLFFFSNEWMNECAQGGCTFL